MTNFKPGIINNRRSPKKYRYLSWGFTGFQLSVLISFLSTLHTSLVGVFWISFAALIVWAFTNLAPSMFQDELEDDQIQNSYIIVGSLLGILAFWVIVLFN
jgi:uncharacterized membrane protein